MPRSKPILPPLDRLRLQRGCEHLHNLGPRALAGFLEDLSDRIGGMPATLGLLAEFERRLTPAMIDAAGGHRFAPRPLHEVAA